ncbi:unnamed protein product [Alopecurus aequalis]
MRTASTRKPAMPRGKIDMKLIENARDRATRYAKRTEGLQKMASQLATLCAVPVALVCAPAAGDRGRLVAWESEEGVLDRYRAAALPPETRARHTHRSYLETELGKERAKLARARPGALPDWDPALNDMTQDEAREVLQTIDAALRAAGDRMAALGLPADGQLELEQVALAPDDAASDDASSGVLAPQLLELGDMDLGAGFQTQLLGLGDMDMGAGFQPQLIPFHGGSNDHGSLLEQYLMQPEFGLENGGGSYDVGAFDETRAPGGYGDNADCGWPDLTMSYAADESWDAVMPIGYYPDFTNGALVPPDHYYSGQDVTGGCYVDILPLQPMGVENLGCLDMDNSYARHWQAEGFQRSDTSTGHYQYQWSDPRTCSSNQAFHYQY